MVHPSISKRRVLQSRGRMGTVFWARSDALLMSVAALNPLDASSPFRFLEGGCSDDDMLFRCLGRESAGAGFG